MVTSCSIDFKYSTWFCYIFISLLKSEEERAQVLTLNSNRSYRSIGEKEKLPFIKTSQFGLRPLTKTIESHFSMPRSFFKNSKKCASVYQFKRFNPLKMCFKAKNIFFFLDRGINTTSKGRRKKIKHYHQFDPPFWTIMKTTATFCVNIGWRSSSCPPLKIE